jgi:ABC-type branched-subunit amino acid transport system ATPase component
MISASSNKLEYRELYKHFDGLVVFRDVTFDVPSGKITALIGPNGAGKSTLINMTCGVFPQDGGQISKDGRDLRGLTAARALGASLVRTFQNVRTFPTLSVLENVLVAFPGQPGDAPWRLFGQAWKVVEERNRAVALSMLERLGLSADAERRADELPFGSQNLPALARATATGADTLLLDETTTGLEISRVPLVLDFLRALRAEGRTILLVEHNMDVVTGVADSVVVLHGTVIAQGTPESVLQDEAVIRDYLGRIYNA